MGGVTYDLFNALSIQGKRGDISSGKPCGSVGGVAQGWLRKCSVLSIVSYRRLLSNERIKINCVVVRSGWRAD